MAQINKQVLASADTKNEKAKDRNKVIKNNASENYAVSSNHRYVPREAVKFVAESPDTTTFYSVQLGSFGIRQNAEAVLNKVENSFPDARIMQAEVYGKHGFVCFVENLAALRRHQI